MSIVRSHTNKRLSQMVIHSDTVYLAGIVADHPIADVGAQTGQILDQIDRLLAEAGSDKTQMLSATIWLADIRDYDEMNSVWDNWVPANCAPARACVEARLAAAKYLVEIRIVAGK